MKSGKVTDRIKRINRVMMIIIWVVTFVQIAFTIFVIKDKYLVATTVIPVLLILSILITVLHLKGMFTSRIKYIMVAAMILVNSIFVHMFGDLNGIITAFIGIIVIALYQEYKLIVLTGFFCALSILSSYLLGTSAEMLGVFNGFSGIMNVMLTLSIFTYVTSMNANNASKILLEAVDGRRLQEESAKKMSDMLDLLGKSIVELTEIEVQLSENIKDTENISEDVSFSFKNITEISENQNESILSVNENMINQVAEIDKVVAESKSVSVFTSSTEKVTAEASEKVSILSSDMDVVKISTEGAVVSIEEFIKYTKDVHAVLDSVNSISEQINLLSLNASIEAARAGEHGKGFSVVANEVGKLAEESKKATVEMDDILGRITVKADEVYKEVNTIKENTESFSNITLEVVDIFRNLREGSIKAAESSRYAVEQALEAKSYSEIATRNVENVLELSERTSQTVENAMNKIIEQGSVVKKMVTKSEELEKVIIRMEEVE